MKKQKANIHVGVTFNEETLQAVTEVAREIDATNINVSQAVRVLVIEALKERENAKSNRNN